MQISCATTQSYRCKLCGDTGWKPLPGVADRTVVRCDCRGDLKLARVKKVLPPLYHDARLLDFSEPIRKATEQWLKYPTCGLLLLGGVGTGKTYLSAVIARALVESDRTVIFQSAADFYAELRASFNSMEAGVNEYSLVTRLSDVEFLILDDVGSGSLSDHERRSTLHLLEVRLNHLRSTIISSNLTLDEISSGLDERIASRLSSFTKFVLTGRDRRRRPRI